MKRWRVLISYRSGPEVEHWLEELSELHDLVEGGCDFRLINEIIISYEPQPKVKS